jgi:uncharacterized lipoprotein YddW (UPF0748 family)
MGRTPKAIASLSLWLCVGAAHAAEFRAMWSSRFDWPDLNPTICVGKIDQLMQQLANARFNAVFFQVRGQCDVLYPSPEEVWSPLVGGVDPGVDYLAEAVTRAHQRGIELHAYINTHTCWQDVPATEHKLPENTNHLFYAHCNAADPAHRDWLHHTEMNTPQQFNESDYVWLAPGVPDMQAYERRQILYVVRNYDVDGIHFDRIRTPGSGLASHDPISRARFYDPQSNPDTLDFDAWTTDQVTRFVRDTYAAIVLEKPHVKVSAAVYYTGTVAPLAQHQDARAWAEAGALDLIVPMMYFSGNAGSTWDTWLNWWLANASDRFVVAGHITTQGASSLTAQINLTRQRGAAGTSVFSSGSFSSWSTYNSGVYATPEAVPSLPWKIQPTDAIICGTVRDWTGNVVVDAHIEREGDSYTALSSGDGWYAHLRVPPGAHVITLTKPGYRSVRADITVAAGQVVQRDLTFTELVPAGDYTLDGDITVEDISGLRFCLKGPVFSMPGGHTCLAGDADGDLDIDLADFAAFQRVVATP